MSTLKWSLLFLCFTVSTGICARKVTAYKHYRYLNGRYAPSGEICCSCTFNLTLSVKNNRLSYALTTGKRNIHGVATITKSGTSIFITLPIRWDDYQGNMTSNKQATGVALLYKSGTLTFQNYGNAMNNYTLFDECGDDKFIELKKVQ